MTIDLAVVMPVYNEEECIVKVLKSWISTLTALGMRFQIIVLNDGSSDGTQQALNVFDHDNRIDVINKANSGHGPTILMGYKKSVELAEWTFQCDSDNEMKPDSSEIEPMLGISTRRLMRRSFPDSSRRTLWCG